MQPVGARRMSPRALRRGFLALVALIAVMVSIVVLGGGTRPLVGTGAHGAHGVAPPGEVLGTPTRHKGPQGRVGQFVVRCEYSHSNEDDPIVAPGQPGSSHRHDYFGATEADASSSARGLVGGDTTCDKAADTAAYWQPSLYDRGEVVVPTHLDAYYRAAPGIDPARVQPFPFGLELVTGDPTAIEPTTSEAAGWTCGSSTRLAATPPECPATAPLHLVLTFPDCWDGEHVRSDDHRSHAAFSTGGACPGSHPVVVPQLTVTVAYPISGSGHELSLASGSVDSAHGDFLDAWDAAGLEREVNQCIRRQAVCDVASNRTGEALFGG
jgi:hypothetical protein